MTQDGNLTYDAYLYGDSHEGLEERPPIADAEPLDDPLNIDPDTRVRYFRNNIYPYAYRMNYQDYYKAKLPLQVELVRLQNWMKDTGERLIILFEGRDAAGKGGTIRRFMEHWNPRGARVVALEKPSGAEVGQWYFQRYVRHFPTAGEIVLFDRSWYNRAGVERVFGFSTEAEYLVFIKQAPRLEEMIVEGGIHLIKLYFSVSRDEQLRRFNQRANDPLKQWKISTMDLLVQGQVGRVHSGQGGHVRPHAYRHRAVDDHQVRGQDARPDQRHAPRGTRHELRGQGRERRTPPRPFHSRVRRRDLRGLPRQGS